jgi:pimeloyl-ACP methyl ester carboxylesterase
MTDTAATDTAKGAIPIIFQVRGSGCFGWFHAARPPARGVGLVLCRPIGYESICAYGTYTQLAETLAYAGFDVVRFDYHGTGDSAGNDADPDRVSVWIASITAAVAELKRLAGVTCLALLGMRLGATLAAQAASRLGGVDSLVMWAPCASGRAFARELRAASGNGSMAKSRTQSEDLEALGYLYTAQTLEELEALQCQQFETPPAKNVLILGRDDMPGEGPLPSKYREMGIPTSYAVVPGYALMMREPRETVLAPETLGLITNWLSEMHPPSATCSNAPKADVPVPGDIAFDGIREMPVMFGPGQSLFGILAEPAELPASDRRRETAILMLNVGGNYRIGPNRIYVKMARSLARLGYRALRFDLAGIGDSRTEISFSMGSLYSRDSTAEVQAAIDLLVAKGCKSFQLLGICSGSFVAFQTALIDPRVTGQILMNSRLLEREKSKDGGTWQNSMQRYYKSTNFYRRALFHPEVYRRILCGQVDVNGIARRFSAIVGARLKRSFNRLLRRALNEDSVLSLIEGLSTRGTDTLLIIAAEDDGRDYIEFHFGSGGSRMNGNSHFQMVLVEGSDHTFSGIASQQFVIATIQAHLEKKGSITSCNGAVSGFEPVEKVVNVNAMARTDAKPWRHGA